LIKTYVYDPSDEYTQQLRDFWVVTAESSARNIALHPYHHPELTFLSQSDVNGSLMWTMDDYVR
jgi:mannosyl-oligosaccharide alpha-1,2-mannosidase